MFYGQNISYNNLRQKIKDKMNSSQTTQYNTDVFYGVL